MTLMTADGAVLECSESSNADVFQAARVHLGCLGVILTVTLQCVPQFHLQETSFPSTLKEVLVFGSPFPSLRKQIEVLTKGPSPVPIDLWCSKRAGVWGMALGMALILPWPKRDCGQNPGGLQNPEAPQNLLTCGCGRGLGRELLQDKVWTGCS